MINVAVEQGLVQQLEGAEPGILVDAAPQPKKFATVITIGGVEHVLEAGSEEELNKKQIELFRFQAQRTDNQQARDAAGRFAKETPAADPYEAEKQRVAAGLLEVRFKNGDLTTAEYLEQSGLLSEHIEKQLGIPISELAEIVQEQQGQKLSQSWVDASQEFLNSDAGADWTESENNKYSQHAVSTAILSGGIGERRTVVHRPTLHKVANNFLPGWRLSNYVLSCLNLWVLVPW